MIVPMKKVSLIIRENKKNETLKKLRKLGIVHIEITEGSGERLASLREQIALLESAIFTIGKRKNAEPKDVDAAEALSVATRIQALDAEKKQCGAERIALSSELDRLKSWGDFAPSSLSDLEAKGYEVSFYEMPKAEYELLSESIKTVRIDVTKSTVRFMLLKSTKEDLDEAVSSLNTYRLALPQLSTSEMKQRLSELGSRIDEIDEMISSNACYVESIKRAVGVIEKEIEFETYATGMADEKLSPESESPLSVSYFTGYIEAENLDRLKQTVQSNS